eukprot:Rmarinus@m.15429
MGSQKDVEDYYFNKGIDALFRDLTEKLVVQQPKDPVGFLYDAIRVKQGKPRQTKTYSNPRPKVWGENRTTSFDPPPTKQTILTLKSVQKVGARGVSTPKKPSKHSDAKQKGQAPPTIRYVGAGGENEDSVPTIVTDYGGKALRGIRKEMEDRYVCVYDLGSLVRLPAALRDVSYFAVFDGHNGTAAAEFCKMVLHEDLATCLQRDHEPAIRAGYRMIPDDWAVSLTETFRSVDRKFLGTTKDTENDSGASAVVSVVCDNYLYVANSGDARAVLSRKGIAMDLSVDHRAATNTKECERVHAAGGWIRSGAVNGCIPLTRSIGDRGFKCDKTEMFDKEFLDDLLIPDPEVKIVKLGGHDEFIVLGSCGLFDVLNSQAVVALARSHLQKGKDCSEVAELLTERALELSSSENITAIVILLKDPAADFYHSVDEPQSFDKNPTPPAHLKEFADALDFSAPVKKDQTYVTALADESKPSTPIAKERPSNEDSPADNVVDSGENPEENTIEDTAESTNGVSDQAATADAGETVREGVRDPPASEGAAAATDAEAETVTATSGDVSGE